MKAGTGSSPPYSSGNFDLKGQSQKAFQVTLPLTDQYTIYILVERGGRLSGIYHLDFYVP